MKIRQIALMDATRRRLGRFALASTVVCGLGLAAAPGHAQDVGDAGETVEDRLSPDGNRGALERGIGETARSLGEGRGVEDSLRRGAGEAVRGAGEEISGQQLQERFGGEIPQQYQDRTMYRDDQGRMFYWNDQGQQIYLQGQQAQQGQQGFQGQGQAEMRGQARAQQGPTLGVAIDEDEQGVRVLQVMENTAAAEAGLQQGDRIIRFNGEQVQSTEWLGRRVNSMQPGEQVSVTVLRDGQEQEISATLQEGQSYSSQRPALRGGGQGDVSGLRQQVQQLQQEVRSLRQRINQLHAKDEGQTEDAGQYEARREPTAGQSDQQPGQLGDEATETEQRDLDAQLNTEGEAGAIDTEAQGDAEAGALDTEAEIGAERPANQGGQQGQSGQQNPNQGGQPNQGDNS